MKRLFLSLFTLILSLFFAPHVSAQSLQVQINDEPRLQALPGIPSQFTYDSGYDIAYPADGVKGIYVTAYSAGNESMDSLLNFVNETELNSMVIDVKDDYGQITTNIDVEDTDLAGDEHHAYFDKDELMATMEENQIYPIARIVVFKDTVLAQDHPEVSFRNPDGSTWSNGGGESFVNPYDKRVWEYNVEVAKAAARAGFKEIQFDYVRFPENFENLDSSLTYDTHDYDDADADSRVNAVADFVAYAKEELAPYGVEVSVDIFGYAATIPAAPGIGQDFSAISENVDVISSMIYPSHWGPGYFGLPAPDLEPYALVNSYMEVELERLASLENPPKTRPWLQDFTASYLPDGTYMNYGPAEVTAQIQALNDHGIKEFLLWNAGNVYSVGADYSPGY